MECKLCQSRNKISYPSEIAIHTFGLECLRKPAVMVFPELSLCLDCGYAEFLLSKTQLSEVMQVSGEIAGTVAQAA